MNKKILFVSILAVVIITLTSITSVISFQTNKTYSSIASPLFSIRTERAINHESQDILTSNYVGKGSIVKIPITFQTREFSIGNIIQKIKQNDDRIFYKLLAYLLHENHNPDEIPTEIFKALSIINEGIDAEVNKENAKLVTVVCQTLGCVTNRCSTVGGGCLTYRIFTGLIRLLDVIYAYTVKIPVFKGAIIELLYQILIKIYEELIPNTINQNI